MTQNLLKFPTKRKEFVIDACTFIKLFVKEDNSEVAIEFFRKAVIEDYSLYVPGIFIYEIFAICANKNLDAEKVLETFKAHNDGGLSVIDSSEKLLLSAFEMTKHGSKKSGYPSFYDCIYHAIAVEKKCYFITSDEKHIAKSKKFGFVKNLRDIA
jgi:predicted nucleic acid-binding protein